MALKDWKNIRKSKGISTWKNNNGNMIWINDTGNGYTIKFPDQDYILVRTKAQALAYAKQYMRNN